ncbi:MAG: hypothetical protein ACFFD4_17030 [Candidatus Odinarchaeota archaeon]
MKKSSYENLQEFESTALLSDRNHFLTFIDYEGDNNFLPDSTIISLLDELNNHLVLTIAVRGSEFYRNGHLLSKYTGMMEKYDDLTFCIVAGHSAYRSIDKKIPVLEGFEKFLSKIRKKDSKRPVFLGAENLSSSVITRLNEKYGGTIPFILNGDERLLKINGLPRPRAVYSPLTITAGKQRATEVLFRYLLRRKYTRDELARIDLRIDCASDPSELAGRSLEILYECLDRFALTGENFDRRVQQFIGNDIKFLIGNPVIPEARSMMIEQLHQMTASHTGYASEANPGNKTGNCPSSGDPVN